MTRVYYKDAHGALIVFDATRQATYDGALRWKADLDNKVCLANGKPVPAVLIANKAMFPLNTLIDLSELILVAMNKRSWTNSSAYLFEKHTASSASYHLSPANTRIYSSLVGLRS